MSKINKPALRNTLFVCLGLTALIIYFASQTSADLPWGDRIGGAVFGVLLLLILEPLWGLTTLPFSPFSYAFIGFSSLLLIGLLLLQKLLTHVRKTAIDYHLPFSAISIGSILLWVTLLFSKKTLPEPAQLTDPAATGGFPLKAFDYPVPPMGSDIPPLEMWSTFFANYAIWLLAALTIVLLIQKQLNIRKIRNRLYIIAIYISLMGLGYVTLMFD